MDHLDDLPVAKRGKVRDQPSWVAPRLRSRPHDDDDVITDRYDVDEFAQRAPAAGTTHELQCVRAAMARTWEGGVTAVPPDVLIQQRGDDVEVAVHGGLKTLPRQFNIRVRHTGPLCIRRQDAVCLIDLRQPVLASCGRRGDRRLGG